MPDPLTALRRRLRQAARLRLAPVRRIGRAQYGEDRVALHFLGHRRGGFYADFGAHHPVRLSNTWLLHAAYGWRGLNVDADAELMQAFRRLRPRDINVTAAIGPGKAPVEFTVFEKRLESTLDPARAARTGRRREVIARHSLVPRTIAEIFEAHLPPDQAIDFMSVDLEGADLDALGTNDWARFRPELVCVEDFGFRALEPTPIRGFMEDRGYRWVSHAVYSSFYLRDGA